MSTAAVTRVPLGRRLRAQLQQESVPRIEPSIRVLSSLPSSKSVLPPASAVAASAALLLGDDVRLMAPRVFSGGLGGPRPSADQQIAVRNAIIPPPPAELGRFPPKQGFEIRDGHVRIKSGSHPAFAWASKLGECGDAKCACFRLWRPDVRRRFVKASVALTLEQFGQKNLHESIHSSQARGGSIRYVTVGSGQLLSDFLLLCALVDAGMTIESIIAVDRTYESPDEAVTARATISAASEDRPPSKEDLEAASAAVAQLAAFFYTAQLFTFSSLEQLRSAHTLDPYTYGRATTFVHCDAALPGVFPLLPTPNHRHFLTKQLISRHARS